MPLYLREIIVCNFKSFYGEVIIDTSKPFNAIVGPNGAGKSNIMDAISFMVGEKRSVLRVRRLSDLISHKLDGSPLANSAHVTGIFNVEGKSKIFTRCIRGSHSEYKIDNQIVEFRLYIQELTLHGLNIKTKRFLVQQGSIESLCLMNPKEFSTMFDELSKSVQLQSEYERLKEEMHDIDLDFSYMVRLKRLILRDKRRVKSQQDNAEEYKILQNEYLNKTRLLELFRLFHIKKELKELRLFLEDNRSRMCEYESDKKNAKTLLKKKQSSHDKLKRQEERKEKKLKEIEEHFVKTNEQSISIREEVIYLQRKIQHLSESSTKARRANEAHKKTIADLKYELHRVEQLKDNLAESYSSSQGSSIELENAKVQEYYVLKSEVERQCAHYTKNLNNLKCEQENDQYKLDSKIIKEQDIERDKGALAFKINQRENQIEKLKQYIADTKVTLIKNNELKHHLETQITLNKITVKDIEEKLDQITKDLSDIKVDKLAIPREQEKLETINTLKSLFPKIYGRLSTMCKPIHKKYNLAVIKVLWKYRDAIIVGTENVAKQCICYLKEHQVSVETFLPLDSLKLDPHSEKLQNDLRNKEGLKNVQLLHNVIEYSPEEISKAILFVTKNTLLCETAEGARMIAYETHLNNRYACISIDGTYYQKSGIISGGSFELSNKADQWTDKHVEGLQLQKAELIRKRKEALKYTKQQSDLSTLNSEILSLTMKLTYSGRDVEKIKEDIINFKIKIKNMDQQLMEISPKESIQKAMDVKHKEIEDIKNQMHKIEDTIFTAFCESVNVANIREYEKSGLRKHNEQKKREAELENQYDCIQNMLDLELSRNTEIEVTRYETAIQPLEEKLKNALLEESRIASDIESSKDEYNNLKDIHANIKTQMVQIEHEMSRQRHLIGTIAKLILETRSEHTRITMNIEQKVTELISIINNSKMKGIRIPMLSEDTSQSSGSSLVLDDDILLRINFSYLPLELQRSDDEKFEDIKDQLVRNIKTLEEKLQPMSAPNLKATEDMILIRDKLRTMNEALKEIRGAARIAKQKFIRVKEERVARFMHCFDYLNLHIDEIYKSLHNNVSAQATLIPYNPEEPYLDGINYSCIAPGKRFHYLSSLSGGEQVLAILNLLFTMHRYEAAPFIVLDEIDAALDKISVKNVVHFIKSNVDLLHFIVISLNKELFVNADGLIGVSSREEEGFLESSVFTLSLKSYQQNE